MTRRTPVLALGVIAALVGAAAAQSQPASVLQDDEKGMTSYLQFGGTSDSDGQIYELNSNVGYDFSRHFGVLVGVPVYFIRPSSAAGGSAESGIGDPYLGVHLKYPGPGLNFASALTGAVPLGDSKKGLSTGRVTFDWTNHFDHAFAELTPFVELGIANSTPEMQLFLRPYTTLGFNTHFQLGLRHDVWKFVSVGASGYDIVPSGQQTVFSRVTPAGANAAASKHGRVFENNQQTTGNASIAQDDGFSTWIHASPSPTLDLELGYTRSFVYDLNSVSFNIGVNLGQLYRSSQK
jgi:hypothetical protein